MIIHEIVARKRLWTFRRINLSGLVSGPLSRPHVDVWLRCPLDLTAAYVSLQHIEDRAQD